MQRAIEENKTDQKHTQLKPAERGAWVEVGFYEHQQFFGELINSYGARMRSEISLKVRQLDLKTLIAVLSLNGIEKHQNDIETLSGII